MSLLMIPIALLSGWLLGYPDEVIAAGTASACVVRFIVETIQDCLEAML
jgi:hypothetical protein